MTPRLHRRTAWLLALLSVLAVALTPASLRGRAPAGPFTFERAASYPFPSQLTAAIHDVHDLTNRGSGAGSALTSAPAQAMRYEKGDREKALEVAWQWSPVSSVATWRSPVLLIHGDQDRNVQFSQTVDLVQRLDAAGVRYEELVIPDDTRHWLRHANAVKVHEATAAARAASGRAPGRVEAPANPAPPAGGTARDAGARGRHRAVRRLVTLGTQGARSFRRRHVGRPGVVGVESRVSSEARPHTVPR